MFDQTQYIFNNQFAFQKPKFKGKKTFYLPKYKWYKIKTVRSITAFN